MSTQERLATAQWILERMLHWIGAAEVKVGFIITIDIAMVGGLAAFFSLATPVPPATFWLSATAGMLLIAAMVCAAISLMPRLDGPSNSLVYFGRVSQLSRTDYISKLTFVSDQEILTDLAEQIHRNAEIAQRKHFWVAKAMRLSFISAVDWILALALLAQT